MGLKAMEEAVVNTGMGDGELPCLTPWTSTGENDKLDGIFCCMCATAVLDSRRNQSLYARLNPFRTRSVFIY